MNNDVRQRLFFLIGKIPYWESYLTEKQLEATKMFISKLDIGLVDMELGISSGSAGKRIFGCNNNKGALGRLEEAYKKLDNLGFFTKKKKKTNKKHNRILSDKTLEKTKKLFSIISNMNDWEQYLSEYQIQKLNKFLELKSFKACAEYFNIQETTFKQSLLGKTETDGILGKLEKIYSEKHIDNWELL